MPVTASLSLLLYECIIFSPTPFFKELYSDWLTDKLLHISIEYPEIKRIELLTKTKSEMFYDFTVT